MKKREIKQKKVKECIPSCPKCGSEDLNMIGDPEYNDCWECEDCKEIFGAYVCKEESKQQ